MTKNIVFRKSLVIGIIILFFGAGVIPNISRNVKADPGDVVKSFDSPGNIPEGLAWDGQYLWNAEYETCKIYKLDPSDGSVIHSFDCPGIWPFDLTWDGQYLWNVEDFTDKIYKLDPSDGNIIFSFDRPNECIPSGLAWDGQYLWNADFNQEKIYKLDPLDGTVLDSFDSPGTAPAGLTWDGQYLWNADVHTGKIYQIDVDGNHPPTLPIIDGKTRGSAGTLYPYTFTSTDPDEDQVSYYIKWGDGDTTDWTALQASGPPGYTESHTWDEQDEYTITAKAKDENGLEGPEKTFIVIMPRSRIISSSPFLNFLQNHLNLFPILRILLQRLGLQ